ncbi:MAG: hypothetical protein IJD82_00990 [Clostridia bacterium]|nr:hypothetical protein [Clostridia bacterium]
MKRLLTLSLAVLLLCTLGCFAVAAEDALTATVYVTLASKGALAVSYKQVTVTDADGDGALTVSDALYATHEMCFDGGAEAGYNAYMHEEYGLSLGKLWGDDSGNFGYYVNHASAWSLADPVKDGDVVYAFVYADGEYFSDTYSFFDVNTVSAAVGGEVTLTLSAAGYDENRTPVTLPVEGAYLTVDGVKTEVKTGADGKAVLTLDGVGTHVISAVSDTQTLVPPVCVVTVEPEKVPTGDAGIAVFVLLAAVSVCGVCAVCKKA